MGCVRLARPRPRRACPSSARSYASARAGPTRPIARVDRRARTLGILGEPDAGLAAGSVDEAGFVGPFSQVLAAGGDGDAVLDAVSGRVLSAVLLRPALGLGVVAFPEVGFGKEFLEQSIEVQGVIVALFVGRLDVVASGG